MNLPVHGAPAWFSAVALGLLLAGVWLLALADRHCSRRMAEDSVPTGWVRDALRQLVKEFRPTEHPDLPLWLAAPVLLLTAVLGALAVLPLAPTWIGADLSVGVVFFTAQFALVAVAVFLAGWGPNSKYPLLGAYRFIGLMLAYEMPLAITIIAVALPAQSLQLGSIVAAQKAYWNVVLQPLGFGIYFLCALAVSFWGPFNQVSGRDLAGGVEAELSGAPRLLWRIGHHALLLSVSAFAVPLFLGGGAGPGLPAPLWTVLKALLLAWTLIWLSHRLPRVPLEKFMRFAWVGLIPLSLFNLFWVGFILLMWPGLRPAVP